MATQIDQVLKTIIDHYTSETQLDISYKGVAAKMLQLNIAITEDQVKGIMQTMHWVGILNIESNPKAGLVTRVTSYGYYLYNNSGLATHIREQEEERKNTREINISVVKTNTMVKNMTVFQVVLLILTIVMNVLTYWATNRQADVAQDELEIHKKEFQLENNISQKQPRTLLKENVRFLQKADSIQEKLLLLKNTQKMIQHKR